MKMPTTVISVLAMGVHVTAGLAGQDPQSDLVALLSSDTHVQEAAAIVRRAGEADALKQFVRSDGFVHENADVRHRAFVLLASPYETRDGRQILADAEQAQLLVAAVSGGELETRTRYEIALRLPLVAPELAELAAPAAAALVGDPSYYVSSAGAVAVIQTPQLVQPPLREKLRMLTLHPEEANPEAWADAQRSDERRPSRAREEASAFRYRAIAAAAWFRSLEAPVGALASLEELNEQDKQVLGLGYIRSRVVASAFPPPNPQFIRDVAPVQQRRIAEILQTAAGNSGDVSEYTWLVTQGLGTLLLEEASDGKLPEALQELAGHVVAGIGEGPTRDGLVALIRAEPGKSKE